MKSLRDPIVSAIVHLIQDDLVRLEIDAMSQVQCVADEVMLYTVNTTATNTYRGVVVDRTRLSPQCSLQGVFVLKGGLLSRSISPTTLCMPTRVFSRLGPAPCSTCFCLLLHARMDV